MCADCIIAVKDALASTSLAALRHPWVSEEGAFSPTAVWGSILMSSRLPVVTHNGLAVVHSDGLLAFVWSRQLARLTAHDVMLAQCLQLLGFSHVYQFIPALLAASLPAFLN